MIPLYKKSLEEAVSFNEKDLWLESRKENIRCRNSIDTALAPKGGTDAANKGQPATPCRTYSEVI